MKRMLYGMFQIMFEKSRLWQVFTTFLCFFVCVPFWPSAAAYGASSSPHPEAAAIDPQTVQAWQQAGAGARSGSA